MSAQSIETPGNAPQYCYHCGQENPKDVTYRAEIAGNTREFCCSGCLAITQTIHAAGLSAFYATRTANAKQAPKFADDAHDEWSVYDQDAVQREFVSERGEGVAEISLLIDGMTCGACVWLIESWLLKQTGVVEARVNYAAHRATLAWRKNDTKLSVVLRALSGIGYTACPYDPNLRDARARRDKKTLLFRMSVALLCMMQVMMMAVPDYLNSEVALFEQAILRWAGLVLTLPALVYSAIPFYRGAWRDLSMKRAGMDVPVALGISVAFFVSVWNTIKGGAVYYDSVTMFIALLLVSRYVELISRQRSGETVEALARQKPMTAERFLDKILRHATESVTAQSLNAGDAVLIRAGAIVPADGVVIEGDSHVEESMLTGESFPRGITANDVVFAGSVNRENALVARVTAAGEGTRLATILRLVDRASSERPKVARIADRVASWFVGALLALTVMVGIVWSMVAPDKALATVFALLVISCPCALSLATPAALSAAAGALGKRRVLLSRSDALETLSKVTTMVFDKTGTLTLGKIRLTDIFTENPQDHARYLSIARALESRSEHPIAAAFRSDEKKDSDQNISISKIAIVAGQGIEGVIEGDTWRIGRGSFVSHAEMPRFLSEKIKDAARYKSVVFLGKNDTIFSAFAFSDTLRDNAKSTIAALRGMGIRTVLLSGDREEITASIAADLGIDEAQGALMPEEKREKIVAIQEKGEIVAMIGDGINDAPALAQAQISVSLGSATSLAQWTADVLILSDELPRLTETFLRAKKTMRIVRSNLIWAGGYNLLAIPSAALGWVTPLFAAIGMSLSSLFVVLNALRALKR